MRTKMAFLALVLTFSASACLLYMPDTYDQGPATPPGTSMSSYDPGRGQDISYFYDYLQPFGTWVEFEHYGYVWVPATVGLGWRPFTVGRWVLTDYGWTWVSSERWGWAVYHYGRWGFDLDIGWYWVPDTIWAPAWVAWRWDDDHIGWAPIPPGREFRPGYGFKRGELDLPYERWSFVDGRDFLDNRLSMRVLPMERNRTIAGRTSLGADMRYENDRLVNVGPPSGRVGSMTGGPIRRYTLNGSQRQEESHFQGGEVVMFRPSLIAGGPGAGRPKKYVAEKDVRNGEPGRLLGKSVMTPESDLTRFQGQEKRLLEENQREELNRINRQKDAEKTRVSDPAARGKIEEKYKGRIADLKQAHEQEKAALDKRQKQEKDKRAKGGSGGRGGKPEQRSV